MAQHDYTIANGGGAAVRSDINDALQAIITQNSGPTEPTVTRPYMLWNDTTAGALKIRNATDTAWQLYSDFVVLANATAAAGAVGTYVFAYNSNFGLPETAFGATKAGSTLRPSSLVNYEEADTSKRFANSSTTLSGTWRCMGYLPASTGGIFVASTTLWLRIA